MLTTPPMRRDMFNFQEELSSVLVDSVKKIVTNKHFEKTCHRFRNATSIRVQNFPAMNNLLLAQNGNIKNVTYTGDNYHSTITIKNAFVAVNDVTSKAFF